MSHYTTHSTSAFCVRKVRKIHLEYAENLILIDNRQESYLTCLCQLFRELVTNGKFSKIRHLFSVRRNHKMLQLLKAKACRDLQLDE